MSYDYGPMMASMAQDQLEAEQLTALTAVRLRCDLQHLESELNVCKETLARQEEAFAAYRKETDEAMKKQSASSLLWNYISNVIALAALIVAVISLASR